MKRIIRIINYLRGRFSEKQFLVIASILVGLTSGLAAVLLKQFVHTIHRVVVHYSNGFHDFFLFTLFPLLGIGLTVWIVRRFFNTTFKKGSAVIVYAIAKESAILPRTQALAHILTSALTVGFGGSSGLESPLVSAGSGIGSNFATALRLGYKDRVILLACGAAAAIAAAFNSPIAGVLFAIEVLLTDVTVSAFVPLIIASATGALFSKIILKEGILLSFSLQQPFDYHNVPYYIILGILAGLVSLYYARVFTFMELKFKLLQKPLTKVLTGGLMLSVLLIFFPPLFGEGYDSITAISRLQADHLLDGSLIQHSFSGNWGLLFFMVFLMMVKVFATAFTIGAGGNGGNFAPSLCVGAYLGFVFARFINLTGGHVPESNFTLVAMAGILSGIFYAPLTAIFLILEITGGYGLMIPLMIVAALSNLVVRYFEPLSMEGKKLSTLLKFSIDNRDRYLLSKLDFSEMIETNFQVISPEDTLGDLVRAISVSRRNVFPVVNDDELVGVIHLDDVRTFMFNNEIYEATFVKDLMSLPPAVISPEEDLHSILKKFDDTKQWSLPIVEQNKYIGFISKSSILSKYRNELLKTV